MHSASMHRLAARALARRSGQQACTARGITSTSRRYVASNLIMPALSPTMTEGNIANWRVKEGDSFAPGDILLEIETDKATMDVEAQEEGIMAKITLQDGSKGVKVGQRIAVLAETGDDLSSLEMPAADGAAGELTTEKKHDGRSVESEEEHNPPTSSRPAQTPSKSTNSSEQIPSSAGQIQKYPLYPSVQMLLHQKGLSEEEANRIPASGPSGRLLKGDVLAYLGEIESNYAAEQSKHITTLGHLDLSNIKLAAPPKMSTATEKEAGLKADPTLAEDIEIALPVSLDAVFEAQRRLQESLGMTLPLASFIARASEIANERLPRSKEPPSADELFDAVLGVPTLRRKSRGTFTPQVTALGPVSMQAPLTKAMDIIDVLAGSRKPAPKRVLSGANDVGSFGAENIFSVKAKSGEERRARVYLERVKTVLESDPGRCVL